MDWLDLLAVEGTLKSFLQHHSSKAVEGRKQKVASLVAQMVKHLPKVRLVKAMVFPVVMYGYQSWTVKKAEHQRIDAFELWCWKKTLESPLDCKEIQPVHSEDQPWDFFGGNDAEAETPVLWPPHVKS